MKIIGINVGDLVLFTFIVIVHLTFIDEQETDTMVLDSKIG